MDCAIHSAAPEKRRIGGVPDRIHLELRNVAADDLDSAVGILHQCFGCNNEVKMTKLQGVSVSPEGFRDSQKRSTTDSQWHCSWREPINLPRSVGFPRVPKPVM